MAGTTESKAFSFGKLDRMKGIPKTQNLYRYDKTLISEWLKGWEFQDAFIEGSCGK